MGQFGHGSPTSRHHSAGPEHRADSKCSYGSGFESDCVLNWTHGVGIGGHGVGLHEMCTLLLCALLPSTEAGGLLSQPQGVSAELHQPSGWSPSLRRGLCWTGLRWEDWGLQELSGQQQDITFAWEGPGKGVWGWAWPAPRHSGVEASCRPLSRVPAFRASAQRSAQPAPLGAA